MAKRQTRRSISLRAEVFVRLHDFTTAREQADAATVEEAITEYLDRHGAPTVTREEAVMRIRDREVVAPSKAMRSTPVGEDEIEAIRRRAFG